MARELFPSNLLSTLPPCSSCPWFLLCQLISETMLHFQATRNHGNSIHSFPENRPSGRQSLSSSSFLTLSNKVWKWSFFSTLWLRGVFSRPRALKIDVICSARLLENLIESAELPHSPNKVNSSCVFLRSCSLVPCGISHQHQVVLLLGSGSSLYDHFENVSCMYLAYYISVFKCLYRRGVGVVCLAMYRNVGVKGQRSISVVFLYHSLPYLLKQCLSLNLELS